MSRPGSLCVWLGIGLLAAALGGCGGGSSEREPSAPPHLTPDPWLSFLHDESGRPLASGDIFENPHALRPGRPTRPLTLPVARSNTDTDPAITYTLEHEPWPRGLRFDPVTRTLSGTLSAAEPHPPAYRLAYRASAPGHRPAHLTVVLRLEEEDSLGPGPTAQLFFPAEDGAPLGDRAPPLSLGTFVQGLPIPALPPLPRAQGARPGTGLSYDLTHVGGAPGSGALPDGLEFDPVRRTLSGTIDDPRWPAGTYRLDYVAFAPGHVEARRRVRFDLEDPLRLRGSSAGPFSFPVGEFARRELPEAAGGAPPYRYSLVQCPLDWLELVGAELNANPRPEHAGETRLCRYRVEDAAGGFVELTLQVSAVAGDGSPLELDAAGAAADGRLDLPPFPVGEFTRRELPEATGGAPPYRYSLEQCPLDWLELVGTELAAYPRAEHVVDARLCRYRVTDATGAFAELTLHVSAVAGDGRPLRFEAAQLARLQSDAGALAFHVGAFTRLGLPEVTGGVPPYRYALEQCPLDWIGLTGTELGANPQPGDEGETRLCRYRATDAIGALVELLLPVSAVAGAASLHFVAAQLAPLENDDALAFRVGEFTRRSLPEAAGGVPPYRYALEQCPLDWIELIGTELAASPQPEHDGEERLCRYRVTDAAGGFLDRVLEVSATPAPITVFQFENRHIVDRDVPVGSEIEPIILPRTRNGRGRITYELNPILPDGLSFHPVGPSGRPEVRGTPNAISLLTRYCLHARDSTGTAAAPRCFRLRTVGHSVPRFTVNLGSLRRVLLYSRLISTTVTNDRYDIGATEPVRLPDVSIPLPLAFLPPSWGGSATYSIVPAITPFGFTPAGRLLTSPVINGDHPVPTPVVYTYGVKRRASDTFFAAAICFELGRQTEVRRVPAPGNTERVWRDFWFTVTFHDEAVRTSTGEYLCHPNPRGDDDPAGSARSNPVHDALGMVHARRAVRLAHDLIGARVRDPSPGGEGVALHSHVDLAWLRGRSEGFSWYGTGESLLAGADFVQPGGALRLGLVAGFHRTALDYRTEARHLEALYSEGEHATEIVAAHPYAAWRFATGSVVWGSVGAGAGSLRFEDDAPPFDEERRSDLALHSAALGFRHPLSSSERGTFAVSGLAEHIALRIEGDEAQNGIRPRRLRGSDLALGLDWHRRPANAEAALVPSFALGIRRETGDGAADSLIDIAGSLAYRPRAKPLSFDVAASTYLGVAGSESRAWDIRAAARFAPSPGPRGLKLSLRSTLGAASEAAYGLDAELGYGVFGGALGSTVRPYVGVAGLTGEGSLRRSAGVRLRDRPDFRLSAETYEDTGRRGATGLMVRMQRFWP